MTLKQVSVFVQNQPGRLSKITHTLGDAEINIRALSVAEVGDFGIIRMIVEEPDAAVEALKTANMTAKITEVLGIEMENQPGGLAKIVDVLGDSGVNVEYAYAFATRDNSKAVLITRVNDNQKAIDALNGAGVNMVKASDMPSI